MHPKARCCIHFTNATTVSLVTLRNVGRKKVHATDVETNGADQLIFKHAIATIDSQRSVTNYFSAHHA